jgi:hypothetical protein
VNASPTLATVLSNPVLCLGETGTISVNGANTYTWSDGSSFPQLVVNPVSTTDYTVTGAGTNGCSSQAIVTQSVSSCDGVSAIAGRVNISVYPNPNNGQVFISALPEESTVELYSYTGQLIAIQRATGGAFMQFNFKEQANGFYLLKVMSKGKCINVTRLIKE